MLNGSRLTFFTFVCVVLVAPLLVSAQVSSADGHVIETNLNCEDVLSEQLIAHGITAKVFGSQHNTFIVAICRSGDVPLFDVFYTHIHSAKQHQYNSPTGGLTRLNQAINPNGKSRTTGVVVGDPDDLNAYTIKLRTRLGSGKAIDIGKDIILKRGDSILFSHTDIQLGVLRLP